MEVLHDAQQIKEQCQSMFELGLLDLESKAKIEIIYWQIAQSVVELCRGMRYVPEEVKELETALGDQYLCNFSVFQSLLDHWALGQLFPIMPSIIWINRRIATVRWWISRAIPMAR